VVQQTAQFWGIDNSTALFHRWNHFSTRKNTQWPLYWASSRRYPPGVGHSTGMGCAGFHGIFTALQYFSDRILPVHSKAEHKISRGHCREFNELSEYHSITGWLVSPTPGLATGGRPSHGLLRQSGTSVAPGNRQPPLAADLRKCGSWGPDGFRF